MSDSTQNPPTDGPNPPPTPPPAAEQPAAPPGQPYQYGQPTGQPGYDPGPGYGAAPSGIGAPADLGMRFLARLIDWVILFVVNLVLGLLLWSAIFGAGVNGMSIGMGGSFAAAAVVAVVQTAIYLGYFALLESRNGQTVGKMALKLQTQGPGGAAPTLEQALKRNIFMAYPILGIVPFLGIIGGIAAFVAMIMIAVTISQSPTNEGWHDKFAGGTKVVKIG